MSEIVARLIQRARGAPEQRTVEWLAQRHNAITASEFSSAIGEDKYCSTIEYIRKKAFRTVTPSNEAMEWGKTFEPLAARLYTERFCPGYEFVSLPLLFHETMPWLGASPDGLLVRKIDDEVVDAHLVEIKCPFRRRPNGTIPREYFAQMQLQMEVCNINACDFFDLKIVRCTPDDETCSGCVLDDGTVCVFPQEKPTDAQRIKMHFAIDTLTCQAIRVTRDSDWFASHLPLAKTTWDQVTSLRDMISTFDDI